MATAPVVTRSKVPALLLAGVLGICWAVFAMPASGSCAQSTDAERVARADVIFSGLLLRDEPARFGKQRALTFRVSQVYKGSAYVEQQVLTPGRGSEGDLRLRPPGPYLVFANGPAADAPVAQLTADDCSGTQLAAEAPGLPGGRPPSPGSSRDQTKSRSAGLVAIGLGVVVVAVYLGRRRRKAS